MNFHKAFAVRPRMLLLVVMAVTLIISAMTLRAAQPNKVSKFMRAKLEHSQKILEGLATEDYESISKNAQDLSLLSLAASWQVLQTEDYQQHSREFRRAADALKDAAKKKNLDGAALAYVDVTLKCVNCHKYVRGIRIAHGQDDSLLRISKPK